MKKVKIVRRRHGSHFRFRRMYEKDLWRKGLWKEWRHRSLVSLLNPHLSEYTKENTVLAKSLST